MKPGDFIIEAARKGEVTEKSNAMAVKCSLFIAKFIISNTINMLYITDSEQFLFKNQVDFINFNIVIIGFFVFICISSFNKVYFSSAAF